MSAAAFRPRITSKRRLVMRVSHTMNSLSTRFGCELAISLLCLAALEVRAAPINVTSTADSGVGTLRDALAGAADGDTINFSLPTPAAITLTSGELLVSTSVTIAG